MVVDVGVVLFPLFLTRWYKNSWLFSYCLQES